MTLTDGNRTPAEPPDSDSTECRATSGTLHPDEPDAAVLLALIAVLALAESDEVLTPLPDRTDHRHPAAGLLDKRVQD